MEFPISTGAHLPISPNSRICPVCGSDMRLGFAFINLGAVCEEDLDSLPLNTAMMQAFWTVGYHGHETDMSDSADLEIVTDIPGGQCDIHFCSLECLHRFFNAIIDSLRGKINGQ